MWAGDATFMGLLLLSYFMVESNIKDLQEIGFFSFVTCFFLYIVNVTFRHYYTTWYSARSARKKSQKEKNQEDLLILIQEEAIRRMENDENKAGARTTKRLQEKKRSRINISA